jgi:excisionase family DNA binding protein
MNDHYLTTDELLDYLHINLRTIYRLIKAGKIPAVRVGRQWRFRKRDIDAWLSGHRKISERPRVLVLDDEQAIRDLVSKYLATAEYDVETVEDGPAALERLRASADTSPFDLLITDLKMSGMDGLSVIRETRRHFPDLPIIIITAYSTEASAIEAINLGVSGYLTKPFRVPEVLKQAEKALGR